MITSTPTTAATATPNQETLIPLTAELSAPGPVGTTIDVAEALLLEDRLVEEATPVGVGVGLAAAAELSALVCTAIAMLISVDLASSELVARQERTVEVVVVVEETVLRI